MKKTKKKNKTNSQIALAVTRNTIIANMFLTAFKLFAGIFAGSMAMISDAVHSLSDGLSSIGVMIGIKLASKKPDKEHPYGHERFESVAAIILAVVLAITGIGIGWAGIDRVIHGVSGEIPIPGILALVAAGVSIATKEGMYWYGRYWAKKIDSSILMADAWHSRSDGLSSIGSFIGIFGARMGFPILDPLAGVIIAIFILKVAFDIFKNALRAMTDTAAGDDIEEKIRAVTLEQEHVKCVDSIRTRLFGDRIYVDVEIGVDGNFSLSEAHDIAEVVHDVIEHKFEKVKHCMVHVNPAK